MRNRAILVFCTLFFFLGLDQISKIWVKLHMRIYEEFKLFEWFRIHFVENNGMAFGIEAGGSPGKLFLSVFRIVAVFFISYYLYTLVKNKAHKGYIFSVSLILAGALGNIVDSVFYGVFFSQSSIYDVAQFMPSSGGYAPWLKGKVVDMFYFPLFDVSLPSWIPFIGGSRHTFFQYIFNIADSAITVGVCIILVFQKKFFNENSFKKEVD